MNCPICGMPETDKGCKYLRAIKRNPYRIIEMARDARHRDMTVEVPWSRAILLHYHASMYATIYKPVCGWKAVVYSALGAEQTGNCGYATPHEAYREAQRMAEAWGIPLKPLTIGGMCDKHPNEYLVDGKCETCSSEEFRHKMQVIRNRRKYAAEQIPVDEDLLKRMEAGNRDLKYQ